MIGSTITASVLIVDDEVGPRESLRLVLGSRFRVSTAESGEQAIEMLRRQPVDVVTLDLTMPGLGGIETFKLIREMDPEVQILVVSGGLTDLARTLPEAAGSAWIPKPFDSRRLVEAVERAAEETLRRRLHAAGSRPSALFGAGAEREVLGERHDVARTFSHDIRDRLSAVLGHVRRLREGRWEGNTAEALDVIEGSAHEAVTLAVNFLHAEERHFGSLQFLMAPASLNLIVEQVIASGALRARLRRIELRADLDSLLPFVQIDATMISRAVTNVVNDAIVRSPEGGGVSIETRRFADLAILCVRDERLDTSPSSGSSAGMGLALARAIVEAHGGSVSVRLPPEGGSACSISLRCPVAG